MKGQQFEVVFTEAGKAELKEISRDLKTLASDEVRGSAICSLISAGTELAMYSLMEKYPVFPGYATVFKAEEVGSEVEGIIEGDILYAQGKHRSFQQLREDQVWKVPSGLDPHKVVFARMMQVSMTTLSSTEARPPEKVLVTGLGPIGFLAAQIFRCSGYDVYICDRDEKRLSLASEKGFQNCFTTVPLEEKTLFGEIALVVECTGHEQVTLDACKIVRKRGEVSMVGVPWKKNTDIDAHDILRAVFHNYVVLRSGWEWELPKHAGHFQSRNLYSNSAAALQWLADGRIDVEGLFSTVTPSEAKGVYEDLRLQKRQSLVTLFDWAG